MSQHIPIMLDRVVKALRAEDLAVERLIDGTVGGGGHTLALLQAGVADVLACDLDAAALLVARETLSDYGDRVNFFHGSYIHMRAQAKLLGWEAVDAILLDLGLSSLQMDDPQRGFSFRHAAPLDMRFDGDNSAESAHDLVNNLPAAELADILYRYGEERHSRRIARAIAKDRPIVTTLQLAELVARVKPAEKRRASRIHPATQVFQALRIAVNQELEAVESILPIAIDLLRPGGRLAVIAFHSLEDRIVKHCFRELSTAVVPPPGMASIEERRATIKLVNRKAIVPNQEEINANPRSRSAKLRVVEKLDAP